MAPDVVVGSRLCCSMPFAGKFDPPCRKWKEVGGRKPNLKFSLGSKNSMCPSQIPFWSSNWKNEPIGCAVGKTDPSPRCSSGVDSGRPKAPVFVLKKPQRSPPVSNENDVVRTSVFEAEDRRDERISADQNHKSGYVALIGKPNVGKSTLLNQIIGQKLSIVTNKPQTTRHRILGICSTSEYQMILFDTPGVMPKTLRRLDEMMMQSVRSATINADCILVVVDACQAPDKVIEVFEKEMDEKRPMLIVLNKVDLIKPGEIAKKIEWYHTYGNVDEVLPVSAKFGHGVDRVKMWAVNQLPKGPLYYPKDIVSEHTERFFVSEIIREKIFLQYQKEIPYVSQVNVINYTERVGASKDFIEAEIVVERDSQMAILIGKDGAALKLLATASRLDIEEFVGKQVYLELRVKVRGKWREDDELLDYYGYNGKIRS